MNNNIKRLTEIFVHYCYGSFIVNRESPVIQTFQKISTRRPAPEEPMLFRVQDIVCQQMIKYLSRYNSLHYFAGYQWRNFTPKSGGDRGRDTWRARGTRAYNGGLGAEPPAESRAEPLVGVRGAKPPEAERFGKTMSNLCINFPHLLHICKGCLGFGKR